MENSLETLSATALPTHQTESVTALPETKTVSVTADVPVDVVAQPFKRGKRKREDSASKSHDAEETPNDKNDSDKISSMIYIIHPLLSGTVKAGFSTQTLAGLRQKYLNAYGPQFAVWYVRRPENDLTQIQRTDKTSMHARLSAYSAGGELYPLRCLPNILQDCAEHHGVSNIRVTSAEAILQLESACRAQNRAQETTSTQHSFSPTIPDMVDEKALDKFEWPDSDDSDACEEYTHIRMQAERQRLGRIATGGGVPPEPLRYGAMRKGARASRGGTTAR